VNAKRLRLSANFLRRRLRAAPPLSAPRGLHHGL